MYWALTELPRPLIDVRPAVEFEINFPTRIFSFLKDPEHAHHSPEQWAELVSRAFLTLGTVPRSESNRRMTPDGWQIRLVATGWALRGYTRAKRDLIAAGYDAAKVEQMPVGQVMAVDEMQYSRQIASESLKWSFRPDPEGWARLKHAEPALLRKPHLGPGPTTSANRSRSILCSCRRYCRRVEAPMMRRDVSIAADRAIEAIRMHAAQNGGKLPRSLADVSVVPVPNNPWLGTPFPYKVEGDKATLEVRRGTEARQPMQESDYLFEITIAGARCQSETNVAQCFRIQITGVAEWNPINSESRRGGTVRGCGSQPDCWWPALAWAQCL